MGQNQRSYPNVCGNTLFSNRDNFRARDFAPNPSRNNFRATENFAQRNRNFNYNPGHGFDGQNYRINNFSLPNNMARSEGHNHAPTSHLGTNRAHDNDKRDRNYNTRQNGNGYVHNGVYQIGRAHV